MYPMSFADKLLTDSSKKLQIAIRPEKHTSEVYAEIKQLVTKYKGVTPVELFLVNSKTLVKNSFANGVNLESKLIPSLIDFLDKECIKIVKWKSLWKWKTFVLKSDKMRTNGLVPVKINLRGESLWNALLF